MPRVRPLGRGVLKVQNVLIEVNFGVVNLQGKFYGIIFHAFSQKTDLPISIFIKVISNSIE